MPRSRLSFHTKTAIRTAICQHFVVTGHTGDVLPRAEVMSVAAAAGGPDANSTNMGLLVSEMGVTKDVWWTEGRPVAVYAGIRKIHSASGHCCIILNEALQPLKWLPTI